MTNTKPGGNPAWQKGMKRLGGREKGVPNKTTRAAKLIIEEAAQRLGGVDGLVKWAKKNQTNQRIFWGSIFPRLLPLQVRGDPDSPLVHEIRRTLVEATGQVIDATAEEVVPEEEPARERERPALPGPRAPLKVVSG